jgi:hypothetical protein
MSSGKAVFIAIDIDPGTNQFPEIDKVITRENLRAIAQYAAHDGHMLIVREHPAITPMLEALMGPDNPGLLVMKPDAAAEDIAQLQPDVVFYVAGNDNTIWDHIAFTRHKNIKHVPLPGSGGAAELIEGRISAADRLALDGEVRTDIFGFERIARAMIALRPPRAPQPRGPRPA